MATNSGNGSNACYLSDQRYDYDVVVSITQTSLNDNVRAFVLSKARKTQNLYWAADARTKYKLTSLKDVQKGTTVDPLLFMEDNNGPPLETRRNLWNRGFRFATSSALGANDKTIPASIPKDMVSFTTDGHDIILNPIWREFTLIVLNSDLTWRVYKQDPSYPWVFSPIIKVPTSVYQRKIEPVPPPIISQVSRAASNSVQGQIQNQSPGFVDPPALSEASAFSIPMLLLDLSGHPISWNITCGNLLPPGVNEQMFILATGILAAAFSDSSPPLGTILNATTPWAFALTTYAYMVNPYVDGTGLAVTTPTSGQQGVMTLNYLYSLNKNLHPTTTPFPWNWIQANQVNPYHGVLALNRNTLRDYIEQQVTSQINQAAVMMTPICRVDADPLGGSKIVFSATFTGGQNTPTVTKRTGVTQVLYWEWSKTQESSQNLSQSSFSVTQMFKASVDFQDNQIIILQRATCYATAKVPKEARQSAWLMDLSYRDAYTLTVNQFAGLSWSIDHSIYDDTNESAKAPFLELISVHGGFPLLPSLMETNKKYLRPMEWGSYAAGSPAPLITLPAGSTFSCTNARFSDHQDLLVNLIYAS